MGELGGTAKAMVVTPSRQAAVKYRQAYETYISRKGSPGIAALLAFSGTVKLDGDEAEYTEAGMNGFREDQLPARFDTDDYCVLIVADKYQTGFDQKKLCAMYVLKKLRGVSAVQTYSRLNRICPPYEKKTFILDFVNTYEEIQNAFAPFYTATILSGNVNPRHIYDLEAELDAYLFMDPVDIQDFSDIVLRKRNKKNVTPAEEKKLRFCLGKAEKAIRKHDQREQAEIRLKIRGFIRFYEFLLQATCFKDPDLHRKYIFLTYLLPMLNAAGPGPGFDLRGKIRADQFVQKRGETHGGDTLVSDPIVRLPQKDQISLSEAKTEKLSKIIEDINARMGSSYDSDVAVKALLQIRDILLKSEKLKTAARNNTEKDFEFAFYDGIDDALIEGLDQNQEFYSMLLSSDDLKKSVLGVFESDIYRQQSSGVPWGQEAP